MAGECGDVTPLAEVESVVGDLTKAHERLGRQATAPFDELVREMVAGDLLEARREALLKRDGFAGIDCPSGWAPEPLRFALRQCWEHRLQTA